MLVLFCVAFTGFSLAFWLVCVIGGLLEVFGRLREAGISFKSIEKTTFALAILLAPALYIKSWLDDYTDKIKLRELRRRLEAIASSASSASQHSELAALDDDDPTLPTFGKPQTKQTPKA